MKTITNLFLVFMLLAMVFVACNETSNEGQNDFVLDGTLEGIINGKIILGDCISEKSLDTAIIENGKFSFTRKLLEPKLLYLSLEGKRGSKSFFVENTHMTLTGHADSIRSARITGGQVHLDYLKYLDKQRYFSKKIQTLEREKYTNRTKVKRVAEIGNLMAKLKKEKKEYYKIYVKENPGSYVSAYLISKNVHGVSAEKIEGMLNLLDPSLASYPTVVGLRDKVMKMQTTEVDLDKFVSGAHNLSYKVENKFIGKQHKGIVYLGVFRNDNICALKDDKTVHIIKANGEKVCDFKAEIDGKPSSIAVDEANNIYVIASQDKEVTKKIKGRSITRTIPNGAECVVFNMRGEQLNRYKLSGLLSGSGAKVVNDILIVSDCTNKLIALFDSKTGNIKSKIDGMRPCCGILDFSLSNKNEIYVANIGGFRVQSFDFTGKSIMSFGQRGNSLNDFHGCCNPSGVAILSNGAIATVEKDPTRVKVYSTEGAKQIEGIEELVRGCSYIPMIVDSKDNLYLASKDKGIIKCVSI